MKTRPVSKTGDKVFIIELRRNADYEATTYSCFPVAHPMKHAIEKSKEFLVEFLEDIYDDVSPDDFEVDYTDTNGADITYKSWIVYIREHVVG